MRTRFFLLALALLGCALFTMPASAGVIGVAFPAGINADDVIDWANVGPNGTILSNPFNTTSTGGLGVTVSQAGASSFQLYTQGGSWSGNFSPGDRLLFTIGPNGPITLSFASPVGAVGANIQTNYFGAFEAVITAYGQSNNVLGSYTLNGNSTSAGDGSAIFIGLVSDAIDIYSVVFSAPVASSSPQEFSINNVLLGGAGTGSEIPEPSTYALIAGGLALMLLRRRQ